MPAYVPNSTAPCPHCLTGVRFEYASVESGSDCTTKAGTIFIDAPSQHGKTTEKLVLTAAACPQCGRLVLAVGARERGPLGLETCQTSVVWPSQTARPVPEQVPQHIATDYHEAALVLNLSPKASAALSRRCLQAVLREAGNAHQRNLSNQIDAVMPNLHSHIAESIDAVRNIGNFAAHPTKAEASGQIIEVEPGEAEWTLDVLDMLFDFYYVQPTRARERREALDAKLEAAGKPPMKRSSSEDT